MRAPPMGPPANPKPPPRPAKLLAPTPTCPPKPPPLPPPPPGPASTASVIGGIVRSKIAVVTMPLIKRALADLAVFRPAPMSRTLKRRMSSPPSSIVSQLSLSVHCDKRKEKDRLFVGAGRSLAALWTAQIITSFGSHHFEPPPRGMLHDRVAGSVNAKS